MRACRLSSSNAVLCSRKYSICFFTAWQKSQTPCDCCSSQAQLSGCPETVPRKAQTTGVVGRLRQPLYAPSDKVHFEVQMSRCTADDSSTVAYEQTCVKREKAIIMRKGPSTLDAKCRNLAPTGIYCSYSLRAMYTVGIFFWSTLDPDCWMCLHVESARSAHPRNALTTATSDPNLHCAARGAVVAEI